MSEDDFHFEMEAKVYDITGEETLSDGSDVFHEEMVGQVSLDLDNIELSDEEVYELLTTAHAETTLAAKFGEFHNKRTGWKRKMGIESRNPAPYDVVFEDVWMNGWIDPDYLQELCTEFQDGGDVLLGLFKFDTPIECRAESIVRAIVRGTDEFDVRA